MKSSLTATQTAPQYRVLSRIAAAALLLLLIWQGNRLFLDRFVQQHGYPAMLIAACDALNCTLPARNDLSHIALTHTRIDRHSHMPGALVISVKLINQAAFAQPWPDLQLTLTDANGRIVGRRAYSPDDYLDGRRNRLATGEVGGARLELARPHQKAVGFTVDVVDSVK